MEESCIAAGFGRKLCEQATRQRPIGAQGRDVGQGRACAHIVDGDAQGDRAFRFRRRGRCDGDDGNVLGSPEVGQLGGGRSGGEGAAWRRHGHKHHFGAAWIHRDGALPGGKERLRVAGGLQTLANDAAAGDGHSFVTLSLFQQLQRLLEEDTAALLGNCGGVHGPARLLELVQRGEGCFPIAAVGGVAQYNRQPVTEPLLQLNALCVIRREHAQCGQHRIHQQLRVLSAERAAAAHNALAVEARLPRVDRCERGGGRTSDRAAVQRRAIGGQRLSIEAVAHAAVGSFLRQACVAVSQRHPLGHAPGLCGGALCHNLLPKRRVGILEYEGISGNVALIEPLNGGGFGSLAGAEAPPLGRGAQPRTAANFGGNVDREAEAGCAGPRLVQRGRVETSLQHRRIAQIKRVAEAQVGASARRHADERLCAVVGGLDSERVAIGRGGQVVRQRSGASGRGRPEAHRGQRVGGAVVA